MQYKPMEKSPNNVTNISVESFSNSTDFQQTPAISSSYKMEKQVAIISYLSIIGWFVAMLMHGKHKSSFASFHLRQSLGLIITGALLSFIPLIGWSLNVLVCFAWVVSLYWAVQGEVHKVPLLGDIYQQHLDFIE